MLRPEPTSAGCPVGIGTCAFGIHIYVQLRSSEIGHVLVVREGLQDLARYSDVVDAQSRNSQCLGRRDDAARAAHVSHTHICAL